MNQVVFVGVTCNHHHLKLPDPSHDLLLVFLVLEKFQLLIRFLQSLLLYDHKHYF